MIDNPAVGWGVHIDRVEIKDVVLPESMKRSMSRQAEAERERRSRVITAEGELQASKQLAEAAEVMTAHPAALQLRLLQTVVEVAAEKNSTLVLPFPVELLRFLERSTPSERPSPAENGDRTPPGDHQGGDAGEVAPGQAVGGGDDEQDRPLHPPVDQEPQHRDGGERDRPTQPRLPADGGQHDEGDQHEGGDHRASLPGPVCDAQEERPPVPDDSGAPARIAGPPRLL
jgi:hypothetical protein